MFWLFFRAKTILLSQTNMFWLFFIQFSICRVRYWALVELLQGRGFECAWPIGMYFWVGREHGSTFFMRLALWHIEIATNGCQFGLIGSKIESLSRNLPYILVLQIMSSLV
jgi:hypothetical protein